MTVQGDGANGDGSPADSSASNLAFPQLTLTSGQTSGQRSARLIVARTPINQMEAFAGSALLIDARSGELIDAIQVPLALPALPVPAWNTGPKTLAEPVPPVAPVLRDVLSQSLALSGH